jgi:hypothetical protein
MTRPETAKPERNLSETCFGFQRQFSDRNLRNLLPIGSGGEVSPHPRYRSVALGLLRCALLFPPTHRTSVRTGSINTGRDGFTDNLHDDGSISSVPQLIDIRLPRSPTSRCGLAWSDHQSKSLLAVGTISIVFTQLFVVVGPIITRWEWYGKIALAKPRPLAILFRGSALLVPSRGGGTPFSSRPRSSTTPLPIRGRAEKVIPVRGRNSDGAQNAAPRLWGGSPERLFWDRVDWVPAEANAACERPGERDWAP